MSRRVLTQLLASVLAVVLAVAGGWISVPYVLLSPGPAFNTLGTAGNREVLAITGHRTFPTDGSLDLTTVSVTDRVSLLQALSGWLSSDKAVVPRELVYPPDQSDSQAAKQNLEEMRQSQDDATTAALRELGIQGTTVVRVGSVQKKTPAANQLHAGDQLALVDGVRVTDVASLRRLIGARPIGATVVVGYLRDGKAGSVTLATIASGDPTPRPVIGITAATTTTFPVKVDITLTDVGGPSAGLMFALGIIDKLEPGSLTGGKSIAGTGVISPDGVVGPIGGIAQKMRGAVAAGATVFLSPAGNCAEARRARPRGLTLVKVATLKQALAALTALRGGAAPPTC